MNKGDTAILMLNYTINGDAMVEGAYQEIELQINPQNSYHSVKKLLTDGGIEWGTVVYEEDGQQKTFTGYIANLNQDETFKLDDGVAQVQLRVLVNGEVGSSGISTMNIYDALSVQVLT